MRRCLRNVLNGDESARTAAALDLDCNTAPPLGRAIALALQHILTATGIVSNAFLVAAAVGFSASGTARLVATFLAVCGVATLLQSFLGTRLPILQGPSSAFVAPMAAVVGAASLAQADAATKMQHLQGGIIVGAVVEAAIGACGGAAVVLRVLSPLSVGASVCALGASLAPVAAGLIGRDWVVGCGTLVLLVVFAQVLPRLSCFRERNFAKKLRCFSVLIAMSFAWLAAVVLSLSGVFKEGDASFVSFASFSSAPWVFAPLPCQWGRPKFSLAAIATMIVPYIASAAESIGDYNACASVAGAPVPGSKTVSLGIFIEGVGSAIAGLCGMGLASTSYSENIGVIALTRVGSRRVVQVAGVLLVLLGVCGKAGGLIATIPVPIIGAGMCGMFGMIVMVGVNLMRSADLDSGRSMFIAGLSILLGLAVPSHLSAHPIVIASHPQIAEVLNASLGVTMSVTLVLAVVLDLAIPGTREERGLSSWGVSNATGDSYLSWIRQKVSWCRRHCSCKPRADREQHSVLLEAKSQEAN